MATFVFDSYSNIIFQNWDFHGWKAPTWPFTIDTMKIEAVYAPTLRPCGPLVGVTRPQSHGSRALQVVARPCMRAADVALRTAMGCKKKALQLAAMVIIKLTIIGRSIINFVKKDFLKKEGMPLKAVVIYNRSCKGFAG